MSAVKVDMFVDAATMWAVTEYLMVFKAAMGAVTCGVWDVTASEGVWYAKSSV